MDPKFPELQNEQFVHHLAEAVPRGKGHQMELQTCIVLAV
jgi:hypothetical protein